ncbi:MAG TPA: hypothetical protein VFL27_01395 [Candidatus Dormibacteraeota bacterium]|nr:hypothetical protein [Candidatus Dormibacteraeota bacterium]
MARFVRVAHRQGWEVEIVGTDGATATATLGSRQEALAYAMTLSPDWIEVGDIEGLDTPDQHHVWTMLRRRDDGSYAPSPLRWQPKNSV